jgi:hypothetical protein
MKKLTIHMLDEDVVDLVAPPEATEGFHTDARAASPPQRRGGPSHGWFTCESQGCRVFGFVATGQVVNVKKKGRKTCRDCHGDGLKGACETCGGRGSIPIERVFHSHPVCPGCGEDMKLVSEGSQPAGWPRLDMGEVPEPQGGSRGNVSFHWHPPS